MNRSLRNGLWAVAGLCALFWGYRSWRQPEAFQLKLKTGSVFLYQIHYESKGQGRVDIPLPQTRNRLTTAENKVAIAIDAALQMEVLSVDAEAATLAFILQPKSWVFAVPFQEETTQPAFLSGSFRLRQDGSILDFRMPAALYRSYGSMVGDMLALLEFKLPQGHESEFSGKERGFQGSTPVLFQRISSRANELQLHKAYQPQPLIVIEGGTDWTLDAQELFVSVNAERKRSTQDPSGTRITDATSLRISQGSERIRLAAGPLPDVSETLSGQTYRRLMNETVQKKRLGQRTLDDIRHLIDTVDYNSQAVADAYMAVRAFVFLHPEDIDSLLTYINDRPYSDPRCRMLAAVLTDVGSPAAQKALMQSIQAAENNRERKEKLVAHLGMVETLEPEAAQRIYEMAATDADDRVQGAAELAVGVMGHHSGMQDDSGGMRKALAFAEDRLNSAKNPKEVEQALRIFGNLGAAEQVAIVKPYLQAEKESTRREAIRSLRTINNPESHELLLDILRRQREDRMRETALESLSSEAQNSELFQYLKAQIFVETNDRIIRQIITHLANMRKTYPEAKAVLEQFLAQCGKTSVCGFASSALQSL